jgi:hypothetical protein
MVAIFFIVWPGLRSTADNVEKRRTFLSAT